MSNTEYQKLRRSIQVQRDLASFLVRLHEENLRAEQETEKSEKKAMSEKERADGDYEDDA